MFIILTYNKNGLQHAFCQQKQMSLTLTGKQCQALLFAVYYHRNKYDYLDSTDAIPASDLPRYGIVFPLREHCLDADGVLLRNTEQFKKSRQGRSPDPADVCPALCRDIIPFSAGDEEAYQCAQCCRACAGGYHRSGADYRTCGFVLGLA